MDQPDLSTLPKRMRYAADVLEETNSRYEKIRKVTASYPDYLEQPDWRPISLRYLSNSFEEEDEVLTLGFISWIFPVDVNAIEATILE